MGENSVPKFDRRPYLTNGWADRLQIWHRHWDRQCHLVDRVWSRDAIGVGSGEALPKFDCGRRGPTLVVPICRQSIIRHSVASFLQSNLPQGCHCGDFPAHDFAWLASAEGDSAISGQGIGHTNSAILPAARSPTGCVESADQCKKLMAFRLDHVCYVKLQ